MKNLPLSIKAVVPSRAEAAGRLVGAGDAVLIKRGQPRWLILKCPCGCGNEIPVNLDSRAGKAWRLYDDRRSGVTLFPSVWLDTGCESHFIIWRNQILLFGGMNDDAWLAPMHPDVVALSKQVLNVWPATGWVSCVEVADQLGEIPWDVLDACRYLARHKLLVDGRGEQRNMFRRPG